MKSASFKQLAVLTLVGVSLSACGALGRIENIGTPPALSPISNPVRHPGYRPVSMPMPAPPPPTHEVNSLWAAGAHSFFHDPRASHVGDLLTVNISIADAAKISDTTKRARDNSDKAGMPGFFGLENPIAKATGAGDISKLVNLSSTTSNSGTGSVDRSENINLTLAAIVTQSLPNGNMVIRGHQQVRVNNELRDLQISGIVRPEDITSVNTIDLSQIAEARISYGGKGQITDVQQPRYGQQLYDILMPF
jgi:flagellar L-ring protein precursor FlgH